MTTSMSWDPARWRDGHYQLQPHWDSSRDLHHPQLAAPIAINPASQSTVLDGHTYEPRSEGIKVRETARPQVSTLPMQASESDAPSYRSRPYERRHSPPPAANDGPQQVASSPVHHTVNSQWRDLHSAERQGSVTHHLDTPLTLHIPKTQDVPRISPAYDARQPEGPSLAKGLHALSQKTIATSLPSFAAFQEHASRSEDPDVEGPEIAPMSSRLSCNLCTKLKPMVQEVVVAVAELDESIQSYCNKSVTRTLDFPHDSPVRAVQWILDRLRYAKSDLQAAVVRREQSTHYHQQYQSSQPGSPLNPLKRSRLWERDDFSSLKRPCSGASVDHPSGLPSVPMYQRDRRASADFAPRDSSTKLGYSPPPTNSVPGSAYPRQGSPLFGLRQTRALPSPTSLANLPAAAASLPPQTAHSVGSPATSYFPPSSVHTASTNSATSAHIADLQHQVTLKSLALQTLQSEYASMLQKLQRERVKSQTIEKKTSVADQEVNELTGRAEDLSDQVRSLEAQLEETEKKREMERAEAAREKEQWGRMLEMDGRLHAKHAEEKQKMAEEKESLLRRIAAYEQENMVRFAQIKKGMTARLSDSPTRVDRSDSAAVISGGPSSDVTSLKGEIALLQRRIEHLSAALQQVKGHSDKLSKEARQLIQQSEDIGRTVNSALDGGKPLDSTDQQESRAGVPEDPLKDLHGQSTSKAFPNAPMESFRPLSKSIQSGERNSSQGPLTPVSRLASLARAASPGPTELGFDVETTKSTPEELIRALGPIPAPLPQFRYQPSPSFGQGRPSPGLHSSQYHQAPSPYANHISMTRHTESASPRSHHSSPGSAKEDRHASSSSGMAKRQSPENVASRRLEGEMTAMLPPPRPLNSKD